MIQYLQGLRRKKGFTMIELLVVIGIIGILTAIILPNISSDKDRINAANIRATDFYTCVQYVYTKYQKYEHSLAPALVGDEEYIKYDLKLGGNFPTVEYTLLEMFAERGEVQYVHVAKTMTDLIGDTRGDTGLSAYEQVLMNDIAKSIDIEQDGYYYALIRKDNPTVSPAGVGNENAVTIRVYSAHFAYERLPETMGVDEFLYIEMGKLYGGQIMGSCSSEHSGETYNPDGTIDQLGYMIGDVNSYFMDIYDLEASIFS